jgi:hypothetical protein
MIDFSNWKYYTVTDKEGTRTVGILIHRENNVCESRSLQDPEVAKWLAEGNTPLPADE